MSNMLLSTQYGAIRLLTIVHAGIVAIAFSGRTDFVIAVSR